MVLKQNTGHSLPWRRQHCNVPDSVRDDGKVVCWLNVWLCRLSWSKIEPWQSHLPYTTEIQKVLGILSSWFDLNIYNCVINLLQFYLSPLHPRIYEDMQMVWVYPSNSTYRTFWADSCSHVGCDVEGGYGRQDHHGSISDYVGQWHVTGNHNAGTINLVTC